MRVETAGPEKGSVACGLGVGPVGGLFRSIRGQGYPMNITAQDVTLFVSEKNEIDILLSALFKRARARPGFTPPGPEHAPETFILLLPGARGESTTRIVSRYC